MSKRENRADKGDRDEPPPHGTNAVSPLLCLSLATVHVLHVRPKGEWERGSALLLLLFCRAVQDKLLSTGFIDSMDLQPAVQQLLHEPSFQEGNLREMDSFN
ncbi:hypothetical protein AV530_016031 [Patagioenas fasciata monilis]|uniref:Uncharacterized protein n=1 Tax=Patagioenas fasciata monilis TaxID=372326 RepID=A0A1V4KJU2_PATFA|nr:hypothetical protein AV530_016031 [Patagioenas fasciata monilis]